MAVTGAEESLRTIATFGDTGQAALQRLSDKFGLAGGAADTLAQRLSGIGAAAGQQARSVDALGASFAQALGQESQAAQELYGNLARVQEISQSLARVQQEAAAAGRNLYGNLGQIAASQVDVGGAPAAPVLPIAGVQSATAAERDLYLVRQQSKAATDEEYAAAQRLNATYDQLRGAIDPMLAVKRQQLVLEQAVADGALKESEAQNLLAIATRRANDQQRAADLAGGGGVFHGIGFAAANFSSQLQDITVQLQNGTSLFTTLAEQLPQLGYSFGSTGIIIGGVAAVAIALAGALFHLSESHDEAAKAADAQKKTLDGLLQSFQLGKKDVSEFTDGLDRLTGAQKDLVGANLAASLDKQAASAKAASTELADLVASTEQAAKAPGFLERLSSGLAAEAGGAPESLPKPQADPTTAILAADIQRQFDAFKAGEPVVESMLITFEKLKESQGYTAEEAQKLGAEFVTQATVVRQAEEAHRLLVAQYEIAHGRIRQENVDLVNNAEALKASAAGAKAYGDTLADLRERQRVAAMSPEEAKSYDLAKKGGLLDLQKSIDVEPDPERKAALVADLEERRTELAVEARAAAQAEALAQSRKNLAASTQDLAAKEAGLREGLDKEAAARAQAEGEKRKSLTVDGQLAAGGEAEIKRAGDVAVAMLRRADAQSAASKSAAEAARQDEFARKTSEDLVAAQQAMTDGQQGGTAATREAIATRQAEIQVLGQHIALSSSLGQKLVEQITQTKLLTQATQDQATFEKQLQALQDRGADTGVLGRDAGGAVLSDAALQGLDSATLKQVEDRAAAVKKAVDSIPPSLREGEEGVQNVERETSAAIGRFNADLAQSQSDAATNLVAQSRQEAQYAQLRLVAEQQQTPVREQMLAQLAAENELLAKGITLEQIRYDPKYIQDYAQLTHDNLVKTQEDEAKALEQRKQQLTDEVVLQPFKDLASLIGKSMTDGLEQFETTGLKGLGATLTGFATSARNIGNTFASNFITLPLNKAIADFADNLTAKGGTLSSAFTQLFKDNPGLASFGVGAGIGGVGGAIGQQISGNPNTAVGGTFGGIAGGVAGGVIGAYFSQPMLGAFIGSTIGTAIGSFIGSAIGGGTTGRNNDAQGFSYDPVTGSYTKTDKQGSQQNAQAARGLTEQAAGALDILRAAGLGGQTDAFAFKVGNVSGTEYNGQKYASNQDAMQAAIRDLIDNSVGTITDTLKTVLANTKAEDAAHLQQDIAFAGQYDQLTHRTGAYGQALSDLDTQYRTAEVQAAKLGLSTADLAKALADAEGDLKAKFVQQVKVLIGDSGAAGQAIFDLRAQFKAANDDAAKLGFTTGQLADAEARQEAKLRLRYHDQAESLIGAFDPVGEAILRVRDNFDQARAIFLDLGESVQGLAEKEAAAEAKAAADAEDQARQQLQGQGQQIRSLIDGLVDPLKQALSGLGPLAGYVAPQQALSSGLAEFRATYRSAANDDTQAIQALPQEAQQLLQLARQYGGSGPQFAAIFKEVQGDLARVLTAQQDRGDQIMASIPDAIRLTGQQQIDTLVRGFGDLRDKLDSVERTIRLLQPGRLGQAA